MISWLARLRQTLLVLLVLLLFLLPRLARAYTEWLWFGEVGYRAVFWVPIVSAAAVGLAAALAVFLILWLDIRPLLRLRPIPRVIDLRPSGSRGYQQGIRLRPRDRKSTRLNSSH